MAKPIGQERASAAVTVGILVLTVVAIAVILIMGRPRQTKVALSTPRPTRSPTPTATPTATVTPTPTRTPAPITVYVSGAISRPGSYTLPPKSRVEAALAAAGGALENADLSRVNLADILRDGAQIDVPIVMQTAAPSATPISVIINVNTASAEELDTLPGIGPSLAQRIVEYRTANGPFASVDALDDVSGIGPALIDGLRDFVRFD